MLVLSRKSSQQIMIGSDIVITVVKIDRNQVRLGIQAPTGVPILRDELADQRTARGGREPIAIRKLSKSRVTRLWEVGLRDCNRSPGGATAHSQGRQPLDGDPNPNPSPRRPPNPGRRPGLGGRLGESEGRTGTRG